MKLTSRAVTAALIAMMLTGCATTQLAAPAPTPPSPRSVAVTPPAPSGPPPAQLPQGLAAPPVSVAPPVPAPAPSAPTRPTPPASPTPPPLASPAPGPPPSVPSPTPAPPAPPPRVLSTAVDDEQRMRREAQTRIDGTERLIKDIDRTKLVEQQEESYQTIQSFLSKAKEALSARDLQRAYTLADKAYLLASELARGISSR